MATVVYGALLMAIDGFVSLLADRPVIAEPDAGPLIGPVMAIVALLIVFLSILSGLRPADAAPAIPVGRALVATAAVYLFSPLVGATAYAFGQPQLLTAILFFARYLASPFVIASAVLAGVVVLLLPLLGAVRSRAR
jgi:hypothetical protein